VLGGHGISGGGKTTRLIETYNDQPRYLEAACTPAPARWRRRPCPSL